MRAYRNRGSKTAGLPTFFIVLIVLVAGITTGFLARGQLSGPVSSVTEESNTQVIQAVKKQREVTLLKLGIQGIVDQTITSTLFGYKVPGTSKVLYLQYNYNAALGIDGKDVEIVKQGGHSYRLKIPSFKLLGHSDIRFQKAVEKNGLISWATPEVDVTKLVTEVLSEPAKDKLIADNKEILQEQARDFYLGIIQSADPQASVKLDFSAK